METLAERITREGPINELDAVGWIVRLAKKLESMHARGLAHGAVCPEAMKTASSSRMSLGMLIPTGAIRNRLEYRSPERLDTEGMSPTDDAWSTAATLYTLITGSSPFAAGDDDTIRKKIRSGSIAPLSTFDVGDDDLQHILDAALNPSFAQRTRTLAAFREALEGWHPDSKVRELPPMVDDQPEDDDDDARTVMRQVSAADTVRQLIAQREQAAAARPAEPAPASKENPLTSKQSAAAIPADGIARPNHGLLEDDDENAKTAMMSVPPIALLGQRGPATVPAPPPTNMVKSAPPVPPATGAGFSMGRPPGGAAARALSNATAARAPAAPPARASGPKATMVGGFSAKALMEQAAKAVPPPVPQGISRDAVFEDIDNEATVMREAPVDVMRKAKASIAPPAADRKTPVDPMAAVVAASSARSEPPPEPPTYDAPLAEKSVSFGAISLVDEVTHERGSFEPREPAAPPPPPVNTKSTLSGAASVPPPGSFGQTPPTPAPAPVAPAPTPGLATSSLTAPSTPGMAAPSMLGAATSSTPGMRAPSMTSTPGMAAPMPIAPQAPSMPPVAPAPMTTPQQPNAMKGLLIGVGIALVIIAIVAAIYFATLKP